MRLRSLSLEELISHGVSAPFAKILTEPESYHPELSILVGETDWEYYVPPDATCVVPLWDANANSFVRWTRAGEIEYVWLFHDDPQWVLIAISEQGIMSKLWQNWIEFIDSDDECERFAEAIGFRHWEQALDLLNEDYASFERWQLALADER